MYADIHMSYHIVGSLDASSYIALFLSSAHLIQVHIDNLIPQKEFVVLEFQRVDHEQLTIWDQ